MKRLSKQVSLWISMNKDIQTFVSWSLRRWRTLSRRDSCCWVSAEQQFKTRFCFDAICLCQKKGKWMNDCERDEHPFLGQRCLVLTADHFKYLYRKQWRDICSYLQLWASVCTQSHRRTLLAATQYINKRRAKCAQTGRLSVSLWGLAHHNGSICVTRAHTFAQFTKVSRVIIRLLMIAAYQQCSSHSLQELL